MGLRDEVSGSMVRKSFIGLRCVPPLPVHIGVLTCQHF